MVRKVRREANLVPGASLRGLVFDACFDNRIPHTFGMLRHFGMPNRNRVLVSESPDLDVVGLATALRIPEIEVTARRYPAIGRGHRDFYGIHVMKGRIEDRVRRFSPGAITSGVLHHPATHELRDLSFSTVGWDMLLDTCPCEPGGIRQNWVTTNGTSRCHSCGGSLGKIESVPVAEELKPALTLLARLVDPDAAVRCSGLEMLPAAIRHSERTILYDVIMNITKVVGSNGDGVHPVARTYALARACQAVISWPNGLDLVERSSTCPTDVWDWVRRTYAVLDRLGRPMMHAETPSMDSEPARVSLPAYVPSGSRGRLNRPWISAMAAARISGVDEQALKQAWDEGRLTQHRWVNGSHPCRAFDPSEVMEVAPGLRVAGCRIHAANRLGMPLYGVEQMLELGLFTPDAPRKDVRQLESHIKEAARLEDRLTGCARDFENELCLPFVDALRHVSGRPKPWAAAVASLLDGIVPYALRKGGRRGVISRIQVRGQDVARLVGLDHDHVVRNPIERADRWRGVDALECLNGNPSASQLLDGIPFEGSVRKKLYPVIGYSSAPPQASPRSI